MTDVPLTESGEPMSARERLEEAMAKAMHDEYERRAPEFGWETNEQTRVEFDDLPESNRGLMLAANAAALDALLALPTDLAVVMGMERVGWADSTGWVTTQDADEYDWQGETPRPVFVRGGSAAPEPTVCEDCDGTGERIREGTPWPIAKALGMTEPDSDVVPCSSCGGSGRTAPEPTEGL